LRPGNKNERAQVEQKNSVRVREPVGYYRCSFKLH
jgi:hypothetical protein